MNEMGEIREDLSLPKEFPENLGRDILEKFEDEDEMRELEISVLGFMGLEIVVAFTMVNDDDDF